MRRSLAFLLFSLAALRLAAQPVQNSGNATAPAASPPASTAGNSTAAQPAAPPAKPAPPDPKAPQSWLWEYRLNGFTEKDYRAAVDALFTDYEQRLGKKLAPGPKRRAGLKVATAINGLTTPLPLVRAVIGALEARGFKRGELYIVDQRETHLRAAGFLPPPGREGSDAFEGVPVYWLEGGKFFDPKSEANYDDPLAPSDWPAQQRIQSLYGWKFSPSDRISLLPVELFKETDFWINLPVGVDREELGFIGALVNASLGFASNTQRFFENDRSGQMAVVNLIANAPELRQGWVFTLLPLEQYQYIGGPRFEAQTTASEPLLFLSANPVVLDSILFGRINTARRRGNFSLLDRPAYLEYARQPRLNLGDFDPTRVYLVRLPAPK